MKRFAAFVFLACLVWSGGAAAQDKPDPWQWIVVQALGGTGWGEFRGDAVVEISGNQFRAHLRDQGLSDVHYEVFGTLKPGKIENLKGGVSRQTFTLAVTVKTMGSDMGSSPYHGTLTKDDYGSKSGQIGARGAEYISLTDGYNYFGLQRLDK